MVAVHLVIHARISSTVVEVPGKRKMEATVTPEDEPLELKHHFCRVPGLRQVLRLV